MINNLTKIFSNSNTSLINNQSVVYNFNKQNNVNIGTGWNHLVTLILTSYFKKFNCLISKPVFIFTPNKIIIHLFYYRPEQEVSDTQRKLKANQYKNKSLDKFKRSLMNRIKLTHVKLIRQQTKLGKKNISLTRKDTTRLTRYRRISRSTLFTLLRKSRINAMKLFMKLVNSRKGRVYFFNMSRFNSIAMLLSRILNTNIELQLVRLKYPYHDSNILAQLIGKNGKKLTYGRIKKILFDKATIFTKANENKNIDKAQSPIEYGGIGSSSISAPNSMNLDLRDNKMEDNLSIGGSGLVNKGGSAVLKETAIENNKAIATLLTGIKIRISGRLARQRVVPKRTVKTAYKGGISKSKNNLVDYSTYTSKNKKGAFSVRVWLSHGIQI